MKTRNSLSLPFLLCVVVWFGGCGDPAANAPEEAFDQALETIQQAEQRYVPESYFEAREEEAIQQGVEQEIGQRAELEAYRHETLQKAIEPLEEVIQIGDLGQQMEARRLLSQVHATFANHHGREALTAWTQLGVKGTSHVLYLDVIREAAARVDRFSKMQDLTSLRAAFSDDREEFRLQQQQVQQQADEVRRRLEQTQRRIQRLKQTVRDNLALAEQLSRAAFVKRFEAAQQANPEQAALLGDLGTTEDDRAVPEVDLLQVLRELQGLLDQRAEVFEGSDQMSLRQRTLNAQQREIERMIEFYESHPDMDHDALTVVSTAIAENNDQSPPYTRETLSVLLKRVADTAAANIEVFQSIEQAQRSQFNQFQDQADLIGQSIQSLDQWIADTERQINRRDQARRDASEDLKEATDQLKRDVGRLVTNRESQVAKVFDAALADVNQAIETVDLDLPENLPPATRFAMQFDSLVTHLYKVSIELEYAETTLSYARMLQSVTQFIQRIVPEEVTYYKRLAEDANENLNRFIEDCQNTISRARAVADQIEGGTLTKEQTDLVKRQRELLEGYQSRLEELSLD
jgi:hypothetical protein